MGQTSRWYGISKYLGSDETPKRWAITDLNPDQNPEDLAKDLADHFSEITNLHGPLLEGDIPRSKKQENLTRLVTKEQVAARLKKMKIPQSRVEGDIPRHLIKPLVKKLALPLTEIFNNSFINESWPKIWKIETIASPHSKGANSLLNE